MENGKSFAKYSLKLIFRDNILSILILAPILTGIAFKILIPYIDIFISKRFHVPNIFKQYYMLIDIMLAYLSPCFFSIISSLVVLEELDENTSKYLMVTPIGKKGYLIWRLFIPCILAFILSIVLLSLFSLSNLNMILIFLISALSTFNAILMAVIVITFARNKVEGLAWTKIVNLNIIFIFIPFLYGGKFQKIFSIFPSYWISLLVISFYKKCYYLDILYAILITLLWFLFFYRRFTKKVFY